MTTKTKHTEGPWSLDGVSDRDNTIKISEKCLCGKGHNAIAYVSPRAFYKDDQEANARLIAAAPELLAACHLVLKALEDPTAEDVEALTYSITAAINKAEGTN